VRGHPPLSSLAGRAASSCSVPRSGLGQLPCFPRVLGVRHGHHMSSGTVFGIIPGDLSVYCSRWAQVLGRCLDAWDVDIEDMLSRAERVWGPLIALARFSSLSSHVALQKSIRAAEPVRAWKLLVSPAALSCCSTALVVVAVSHGEAKVRE